jgi:hypothetical protein
MVVITLRYKLLNGCGNAEGFVDHIINNEIEHPAMH